MASDLERVRAVMASGEWCSLEHVAATASVSLVSVSSRIRDLRKRRYGECIVEGRRTTGRRPQWEYRLLSAQSTDATSHPMPEDGAPATTPDGGSGERPELRG